MAVEQRRCAHLLSERLAMAKLARVRIGPYGYGGITGVKTSLYPNDVNDTAFDDSSEHRSFNSNWTNLSKLKIIGSAQGTWTPFQRQRLVTTTNGFGDFFNNYWSDNGWQMVAIGVPTGLTYIPIWEERIYDPTTKTFYDDNLVQLSGAFSGARSYFSGPGLSPNILWFAPWEPYFPTENVVVNSASTQVMNGTGSYPPYPAPPAKPADYPLRCAYMVYADRLGDVA